MRVLSVDIGFRICGYVICDVRNLEINLLKEDEVKAYRKHTLGERLNYIFETLRKEIKKFKPEVLVIEKLYSHYRHPTTLGLLGQVRGVVVLLAKRCGINLFEYSTTQARKSFLGKGNAKSIQVKKMAEHITNKTFKSTHTADAFSLVVAFSHMQKFNKLKMAIKSY